MLLWEVSSFASEERGSSVTGCWEEDSNRPVPQSPPGGTLAYNRLFYCQASYENGELCPPLQASISLLCVSSPLLQSMPKTINWKRGNDLFWFLASTVLTHACFTKFLQDCSYAYIIVRERRVEWGPGFLQFFQGCHQWPNFLPLVIPPKDFAIFQG